MYFSARFRVFVLASIACLTAMLIGCAGGDGPDEYRESKGRVAKFSVRQTDDYLRIVTFVRLSEGRIQDPKRYYYQGHYTAIGVRDVEKPGGLFDPITRNRQFLYLPVSKEIEKYLFLVSKPIFREEKQKDGTVKQVTEWTDWYLLEVPATEVAPDKPLVIPPFDEIVANADIDPDLLEKLRSMYETARIAAEKKANTPVKNQWEWPWYTW